MPSTLSDRIDALTVLRKSLVSENYEQTAALCQRWAEETDDANLQQILRETHVKALGHLQNYQKIKDLYETKLGSSEELKTQLKAIYYHALYRLQDYPKALEHKEDILLQAQCYYHTGNLSKAEELFQKAFEASTNNEERNEILTNLAAIRAANACPYVAHIGNQHVDDLILQGYQQNQALEDLQMNVALWKLTTDAADQKQYDQDLSNLLSTSTESKSSIKTTLDWSRMFWSNHAQKMEDAADELVRKIQSWLVTANITKLEDVVSENALTPIQRRVVLYDIALLYFMNGKLEDCQKTCDKLLVSLKLPARNKKLKKKQNETSQPHIPVSSPEEKLWWESRIDVLLAYCSPPDAVSFETKERLEAAPASPIRDHALTYLLLHEAKLTGNADMIRVLQSLPVPVKASPAVISTLASLYEQQGKSKEAQALIQGDSNDSGALAMFAMAQGKYREAADLLREAAATDDVAKARYVQALSYIDPDEAKKVWSTMEPNLISVDDNGEDLEELSLPKLKSGGRVASQTNTISNKTKKLQNKSLQQRAKKREAYLDKLAEQGKFDRDRPSPPDPERWLPKYERSSSRRRRGNKVHKGAQGGISEKDALKLDVVARKEARASGEAPDSRSTAHLVVKSSDGRFAGSRR